MKVLIFTTIMIVASYLSMAQTFDLRYVQSQVIPYEGETYSIVDMSRKDNRVKVKYFAAKDYNGTSVQERFTNWSRNKNIILYSSGTYMTKCDASIATPDGLCIDAGEMVNKEFSNKLGGIVIVQATGGVVASSLKERNLNIVMPDNTSKTVDLNNAFDRSEFYRWAGQMDATVFQTHLLYYKNQLMVYNNSSSEQAKRRFLVVGKDEDGIVHHYVVYLYAKNTLKDATEKIVDFIKNRRDIEDIVFVINLDTGCQDVYQVWNGKGGVLADREYKGITPISNAANLLVYYFE